MALRTTLTFLRREEFLKSYWLGVADPTLSFRSTAQNDSGFSLESHRNDNGSAQTYDAWNDGQEDISPQGMVR